MASNGKLKIGILITSTSNGRDWKSGEETYLYSMLKSLYDTLDKEHEYYLYIGIDRDDKVLDKSSYMDLIRARTPYQTLFIYMDNIAKGHLTVMWNKLFSRAYADGCNYFYQCGDDIVISKGGWVNACIRTLVANKDIGVTGPNDGFPFLTQNFVSRKHYNIWGFFFPADIINWYCDNWIADVYRSIQSYIPLKSHTLKNNGGTRYSPDDNIVKYREILRRDIEYLTDTFSLYMVGVITEALYGSGDNVVNVTKIVNDMLARDEVVGVNNGLAGDPCYGVLKTMKITLYNGRHFEFNEGDQLCCVKDDHGRAVAITDVKKGKSKQSARKMIIKDLQQRHTKGVTIMVHPSSRFIASLMEESLVRFGYSVSVISKCPDNGFVDCVYFVVEPHKFKILPVDYISINGKERKDGFTTRFVSGEYYVPLDYLPWYHPELQYSETKDYVLVYSGDDNPIYNRIKECSNARLASEEPDLPRAISAARLIVNLIGEQHPGLFQCLSLHKKIISVKLDEPGDPPGPLGLSSVVPQYDLNVDNIQSYLQGENPQPDIRRWASGRHSLFRMAFATYLLSHDVITFDNFWNAEGKHLRVGAFNETHACVDLRNVKIGHTKEWLDEGLILKWLARSTLERGYSTLTVYHRDPDNTEPDITGISDIKIRQGSVTYRRTALEKLVAWQPKFDDVSMFIKSSQLSISS